MFCSDKFVVCAGQRGVVGVTTSCWVVGVQQLRPARGGRQQIVRVVHNDRSPCSSGTANVCQELGKPPLERAMTACDPSLERVSPAARSLSPTLLSVGIQRIGNDNQ